MRITLNLATRPYADQGPALKRLRIGMAALALILALLGLGLMHFHQTALRMAAQEAIVDQSIAKIQQEQNGYQAQMQQPANAKVLTQAEFLNHLFDEKSFSWTAAMEDMERVLPAGVQVTALEPARGKDGRLTLRLRISGQRERSVELVRNMEHSRRFIDPRVAGENSEAGSNAQGNLQPVSTVAAKVSFDILAEYSPATLEERKAMIAAQKQKHPASTGSPQSKLQSAPSGRARYMPPNPQAVPRQTPLPGQPPFQRPLPGPIRGPNRNRIPIPGAPQPNATPGDPQ